MVTTLKYENTSANVEQLRAEVRAVIGEVCTGAHMALGHLFVHIEAPDPVVYKNQVDSVVAAHNPAVQTARQQIRQEARLTREALSGIIGDRIAWHEANPVTGANAVEVAGRMQTELIYLMKWVRKDLID